MSSHGQLVMGVSNQWGARTQTPELRIFDVETVEDALKFCSTHPAYGATSLVSLANLAEHLRLKSVYVKDESERFGLKAFKVMGALHGVGRYLAGRIGRSLRDVSFEKLKALIVSSAIGEITFVSATDGNHGRAVAWAARELGHRAVIYMPKGTSQRRLNAILAEGASAEITDLNYDDCVRLATKKGVENGWVLVQDTAWDGYTEIPLWIMQGYAAIAREITDQMDERPTHVFLQAGVGSFAGSVSAYLSTTMTDVTPVLSIVEPNRANCFYRSLASGKYTKVSGDLETIMVGLACGEPNPTAWEIVRNSATAAFSCEDEVTALGMRILGNPLGTDRRIVSGESGGVTAGLLYFVARDPEWRDKLKLGTESVVLLISTEGDTDVERYRDIVWKGCYSWPEVYPAGGVRMC